MIVLIAVLLAVFVLDSPWNVAVVVGAIAFEGAEAWFLIRLSKRRQVQMGAETMVGEIADVVEPLRPDGRVRLHGELWRARCEEGALRGERVRVRSLEGLTLEVERE
jgi:membrane protein implicated in regulation of membrane protease activity